MENYKTQIIKAGYQAHLGTSFSPEKRAEQEYEGAIGDYNSICAKIDKLELAEEVKLVEKELLKEILVSKTLQYLHVKSGCISTMITGGSNFPVRRAEKANNRERAASTAYCEFVNTYADKIRKKHGLYANNNIRTEDENAVELLEKKLEQLEKAQKMMVEANKIIRKYKTDEARIEKLVELGLKQEQAEEILKKDFAGRIGFASYSLTNNNANIANTRERLEKIKKLKTMEVKEFISVSGVKVEDNPADNRVRIFFDGKPSQEVITELKHYAFRWTPSLGCWQAYRNNRSVHFCTEFLKR